MRTLFITFAVAGLAWAQSSAQDSGRLEEGLRAHEQAFRRAKAVEIKCERRTRDKAFKDEQVSTGTLRWLRDDPARPMRMSLKMAPQGNPDAIEGFVFTGTHVYLYSPQRKEISIAVLPKDFGEPDAPNVSLWVDFLRKLAHSTRDVAWLVGCCDSRQARERYRFDLTGEDEDYLYLKMTPRSSDSSFSLARISIRSENHLPRQLWFQQGPGTEVRWDFLAVNTEAKLQTSDFRDPPLPTGWKYRWPAEGKGSPGRAGELR